MTSTRRIYAFIDGAYLQKLPTEYPELQRPPGTPQPFIVCPWTLSRELAKAFHPGFLEVGLTVRRVHYYDAIPLEVEPTPMRRAYIAAIEALRYTEVRYGFMPPGFEKKGKASGHTRIADERISNIDLEQHRQKAVDVQLAVDLVVGAFNSLFDEAILVTGDADFIPAVQEARRRGVDILLATDTKHGSRELREAADVTYMLNNPWPRPGEEPVRFSPLAFERP